MKSVTLYLVVILAVCGAPLTHKACYGFLNEGVPTMSKECLEPRHCWICGECVCKSDGVVSPRLVFNPSVARLYFSAQYDLQLLKPECGKHHSVDDLMEAAKIDMPCGKCMACQLRKRKDMSVRLAHEASQHESCCFITLTYDEDRVPTTDDMPIRDDFFINREYTKTAKQFAFGVDGHLPNRTLFPYDVQCFVKRLRRHLEYVPKKSSKRIGRDHVDHPIRYFAVGEYGSKTHRPHYHLLIFGWQPSDAEFLKLHNGNPVFTSKQIQKLWKFGFSPFSAVTPYVAKYCARYVTKKFTRKNWDKSHCVIPEFTLQSVRNGGIGATWFDKYGADACRRGLCTVRVGDRISNCAIPPYYWNRLRKIDMPLWLDLRDVRMEFALSYSTDKSSFDDVLRKVQAAEHTEDYYAGREFF